MADQLIPFLNYQVTCAQCGYKGDAKQFPVLLSLPICKTCYRKQ